MLTSTLQFDTLDVEHRHTVYYESHRSVESHKKFVFDHSHKRLRLHLHIFACLAILILNSQSKFNCNCYQEPDWLLKIRIVNMQNYVGAVRSKTFVGMADIRIFDAIPQFGDFRAFRNIGCCDMIIPALRIYSLNF
jgi:hypothetical protein